MSHTDIRHMNYQNELENGVLVGSHCQVCDIFSIPPRKICPVCHSEQNEVVQFSGKGELVAYSLIGVPPVMMAENGFSADHPYYVGIVELAEGVQVSAQIMEANTNEPGKIHIGTKLMMTTTRRKNGEKETAYLAFKAE